MQYKILIHSKHTPVKSRGLETLPYFPQQLPVLVSFSVTVINALTRATEERKTLT